MRQLVGPTEEAAFDNPTGDLVYPYLPAAAFRSVFDFGCGCGRVARQLIQQHEPPERYVGVDLHRGMVRWCRENLAPHAHGFEFHHHDVYDAHFNPRGRAEMLPLPGDEGSATLVNAFSVFTHLTQAQAAFYIREVARLLAPEGFVHSTWFLFDRREFPMLQGDMAALYVSYEAPSAAVIFDRTWLRARAADAGLVITQVQPPAFRGYQWTVVMEHRRHGLVEVDLPVDTSPPGTITLPQMPHDASRIGLRGD